MVENLTHEQMRTALRFFLHTMPMDQRGRLMGELPVVYAALHPDVDPEVIAGKVAVAIANIREDIAR